ncbi:MAG: HlyD family efflux transporter periplasmic adaptor subunit, partial [Planctomycetota bacterium]|nr:HlyD family efflux transporter periplasmic adaptor subunit [Planctomycetota bacterium]
AAELAVADWKRISSDTPSDITARRPQLSLATAAVDAAAAQVALSQLNLSRCKLTAPFDGRVLNLKAESGQWLAPGSVVADLQPTTGAEVNIPLNEGQLKLLQLPTSGDCRDLEVTAIIPGQHQSVSAKLIRISSQLEQGTRMTQAVAQLPDGLHIPPHTYLELFINGPTVDDAIKLPTAAVDGGFAFVVNNDSTLDIVELNIIQQTNDHFFVSGLEDGQLVSITPLSVFVPGMQIEVNNN